MASTRANSNRYLKRIVFTATATLASVALATNAQAAEYKVIGTGGTLHVHTAPSLSTPVVGNLGDGTAINIVCQTTGDTVVGSSIWDRIDSPTVGYVADWYTTTPAVGQFSKELAICDSDTPPPPPPPPPPLTPSTPTYSCRGYSSSYKSIPLSFGLSGTVCYNGSGHPYLQGSLKPFCTHPWWMPQISCDLWGGTGAFWDNKKGAFTLWANWFAVEGIPIPGLPTGAGVPFHPYSRIWIKPSGSWRASSVI